MAALAPKTGSEIIADFETQVDDLSELSTDEELMVLNRVYRRILSAKDWLFLNKPIALTTDGTNTIDLPEDFGFLVESAQYTNRFIDARYPHVLFVGPNKQPYYYINQLDRQQYDNQDGYFYIDLINMQIVFTKTPSAGLDVSGDYSYVPEDITETTSPVIPAQFHDMFPYGMYIDDMIIQMFDKQKAYMQENGIMFNNRLNDMKNWNDKFIII